MLTSLITLSLDYILTGSNNCYMFTLPMICLRFYMSPSDKQKVSDKIPSWFDEVVCGVMLGDGTIRMNGKLALLGIQQTHEELVETLWAMCSSLNLVYAPILEINRSNWKTVYSFQTLTLPTLPNCLRYGIQVLMVNDLKFYLIQLILYLAHVLWLIG